MTDAVTPEKDVGELVGTKESQNKTSEWRLRFVSNMNYLVTETYQGTHRARRDTGQNHMGAHAFLAILFATRAPATIDTIVVTTKVKGPYPGFTDEVLLFLFPCLLPASSISCSFSYSWRKYVIT